MAKSESHEITLGTRGSRLATWQANHVKSVLEKAHPGLKITIQVIKTSGDQVRSVPLGEAGGKYLFVKEIEEALLKKEVDIGVHSIKDLPATLPTGLGLGAILKREDPRDVFVSKKIDSLLHLPKKARVGTSSIRRHAQLKNFRPDLEIVPLRGNVETRLRKLSQGNMTAIILAAAGLIRLGLGQRITEYLPTSLLLPAVGQGAIGLEVRDDRVDLHRLIEPLNDVQSANCILAERTFLKTLQGDCYSPIAAYAEINGMSLKLTGMVATPDGRELIRDRVEGNIREAQLLGDRLAKALFSQGARELLRISAEHFKK